MKKIATLLFCFTISIIYSQDWAGIAIPANAGDGKEWVIQNNVSDDFNYSAPATNKGSTYLSKWDDFYHNTWTGPGLTVWQRDHSLVEGGELKLIASRLGVNQVNAGAMHSNATVVYPVYVEIRAKIMNSVLANGGWMLSPDDTQEIDFMEGYGAAFSQSANRDHSWYAQRMHLSHHVFIRSPFQDWQPSEFGNTGSNPSVHPTWITRNDGSGNINWRDDYHRYGVYWEDPTHLYYYIDGVLVTQREGMEQIDPLYYTNTVNQGDTSNDTRTGLNKAMFILFTVEDQDWRSSPQSGLQSDTYTPTDTELANTNNHTLHVDWIRVYKPENVASVDEWFTNNLQIYPNPINDSFTLKADVILNTVEVYTMGGVNVLTKKGINSFSDEIFVGNLTSGLYILKIKDNTGALAVKKVTIL